MPSSQSPSPAQALEAIQEIFGEVSEDQEARLRTEAEALNLQDLAEAWDLLDDAARDPQAFLDLWRRENPSLPLDKLESLDPYAVAVGVLKLASPEES